jgi:hypothetical protein
MVAPTSAMSPVIIAARRTHSSGMPDALSDRLGHETPRAIPASALRSGAPRGNAVRVRSRLQRGDAKTLPAGLRSRGLESARSLGSAYRSRRSRATVVGPAQPRSWICAPSGSYLALRDAARIQQIVGQHLDFDRFNYVIDRILRPDRKKNKDPFSNIYVALVEFWSIILYAVRRCP